LRSKVALAAVVAAVIALAVVFGGALMTASAQTVSYGPSMANVPVGFKGWFMCAPGFTTKSVEVSQGYKAAVMDILNKNDEAKGLLEQGYTVEGVTPIVKAYVEADGTVTVKAQQAVVVLASSNGDVKVMYLVDIGSGSVTHLATINVGAIKSLRGSSSPSQPLAFPGRLLGWLKR